MRDTKELYYGKNTAIKASKEATTEYLYMVDEELERYWNDADGAGYHTIEEWNNFELQYNPNETFTIGNNMQGGI